MKPMACARIGIAPSASHIMGQYPIYPLVDKRIGGLNEKQPRFLWSIG